jgi:lysophospholipase L1-like esterase
MMFDLSLEDVEFIKILATSDSTILQAGMNDATRQRLDDRVGTILREYYKENTQNTGTKCTEQLIKFGITEDDGKAAIACARRLGIDIS